ncbi:hypothetical protein KQX54_010506 [Cotesia glomerata]|uniref:CCHC-type domain-containing protein n=1 Tax=Cotesia glomerata TaxID=32391 RepID=A0AAV7IQ79_COTGL|nr:hypothetical protein KQX54_010506 [Cotesia glomerata]
MACESLVTIMQALSIEFLNRGNSLDSLEPLGAKIRDKRCASLTMVRTFLHDRSISLEYLKVAFWILCGSVVLFIYSDFDTTPNLTPGGEKIKFVSSLTNHGVMRGPVLVTSLVLPIFDYCVEVLTGLNLGLEKKLAVALSNFARFVLRKRLGSHINEPRVELGWLSPLNRRLYLDGVENKTEDEEKPTVGAKPKIIGNVAVEPLIKEGFANHLAMVNKQTNAMLACATAMERTTDKLNDLMKESMKMVQMLCNFTDKELETKRDRAKKSEVTPISVHSSQKRPLENAEMENENGKKAKFDEGQESRVNKELESMRKSIEEKELSAKINIKKDYKLTQKLEAERKNEQDDPNIKANRVNSGSRGREYRCHRCSGLGHWEQQCPWKEKGMWDCYKCKKMTDHKASDHEKYPDRFRKCESNTFRGKDFKKHDKTEYNKNQYRGRGLEKNEQKGVKSNKNNKSTKNTKSNYNNYKSANNNRDQHGKESLRRIKGDEEDDGDKSQNEKYITFIADLGLQITS